MPRVKGRLIEAPRDANQSERVREYEQLGCIVIDLGSIGMGCPDLLIGCAGVTDLAEVKMPDEDLLPSQQTFNARWRGSRAWLVRTLDDVIAHVKDMRRRAREQAKR